MNNQLDTVGVDGMNIDVEMSSEMITSVNNKNKGHAKTIQEISIGNDNGLIHIWALQSKFDYLLRKYVRADPWKSIQDEVKTMRKIIEEVKGKEFRAGDQGRGR